MAGPRVSTSRVGEIPTTIRRAGPPLAAALLLAAPLITSCGPRPAERGAQVRPLPTDVESPTAPTGPEPSTAPGEPPVVVDDPARLVVEQALDRYGRALTDLAALPAALDDPGLPAAVAWDDAVVAGSALSGEIAARIRTRAVDGVVVVPPEGGGRSFVHHPLEVTPVEGDPDRIAFTWCGWSPGIGLRADGSVVDDDVAHARGTGTVERTSGTWKVASLDQSRVDLLPPGSPDPCPDTAPAPAPAPGP